jgi:predicted transposase/invertase (TIGR01784 family)
MSTTLVSFDWAIKDILRNKANFGVLSGFLTELLNRTVIVQEILESESNKSDEDDKFTRLDLKAKIDNGEIAIFEVQINREGDFFHRILYGTSKAVTEQLSQGDKYGKIKKVYSVDIVYFDLGSGSDYIYHGTTNFVGIHTNETLLLSDSEKKFLSPSIEQEEQSVSELFPEYYLILPNKFDERLRNRFDEWVYTLKTSKVRVEFTAAGIQEAGKALDVKRMSEQDYIDYQAYLKKTRVRDNEIESAMFEGELKGRAEGRAEGKAEGRAEGKAEGRAEIAKVLKQRGMSDKEISEITGLTVEEIEKL